MTDVLAAIPLVGLGPELVVAAVAVLFLVLAVLLWRRHKVWRWVMVLLFLVFGLATAADVVNTRFAYFDTVADLLGIPTYPVAGGGGLSPGGQPQDEPEGAAISIQIPDTQSHFGSFDAKVWLPPQYFSDTRAHFPVMLLLHGNPGDNTNWLSAGGAATTGLAVAQSGKPVILVMPAVLQNNLTGDSLCVDTQSQGNAETYVVQDVVTAVDRQLRTQADVAHRGIGGFSMGGFCALNLGLKHPDVFSVVLDFSGETSSSPDSIAGGNQALYGGADWQQQADANSPSKYYPQLDASKGPAIWMDCGVNDTGVLAAMQDLAPKLKAKGFTVELHTRPGGHDFTTWTDALKDALPWAAARLHRSSPSRSSEETT